MSEEAELDLGNAITHHNETIPQESAMARAMRERHDLSIEVHSLRSQVAELQANLEKSDARIANSQTQIPVAFETNWEGSKSLSYGHPHIGAYTRPLFAEPLIPPNTEAMVERARAEEWERLGKLIHYPECWDTVCYRTLDDALTEIGCSECRARK